MASCLHIYIQTHTQILRLVWSLVAVAFDGFVCANTYILYRFVHVAFGMMYCIQHSFFFFLSLVLFLVASGCCFWLLVAVAFDGFVCANTYILYRFVHVAFGMMYCIQHSLFVCLSLVLHSRVRTRSCIVLLHTLDAENFVQWHAYTFLWSKSCGLGRVWLLVAVAFDGFVCANTHILYCFFRVANAPQTAAHK